MKSVLCFATWLGVLPLLFASVVPRSPKHALGLSAYNGACTNGPTTRQCWGNGFDLFTDPDLTFPTTGKTVTYNWEVSNSTCDPDGIGGDRICFRVNGQYPGPLLRASWGDTVVVNIKNSMQHNGTSVHWHGVRQLQTVGSDGVGGITECPIAPGDERTYSFQVTQYGTSWYHSHLSAQYGDGVVGPIIFDGPASANYDIDLGQYTINEWYYPTSWQVNSLGIQALQGNGTLPPHASNILINGTNVNANGTGQYNQVNIAQGNKYRLRLVNIGIDNYLYVSLDSHVMQVISADFIPIEPSYAEMLILAPGQRYDVVIEANQTADNYWFHAHVAPACGSTNNHNGSAIWTYDGVTPAIPVSTPYTIPYACTELSNLAPIRQQSVPPIQPASAFQDLGVNETKQVIVPGGAALVFWALNATAIDVAWEKPTIKYLMEGNTSYPADLNILPTVSEGNWNYWIIQQLKGIPLIPHPIHLHGHDFFVLGQGLGVFDASNATLNYESPPRRDTASVYGGGWLAVAFLSNNPGEIAFNEKRSQS